jgi:hypothetical protein
MLNINISTNLSLIIRAVYARAVSGSKAERSYTWVYGRELTVIAGTAISRYP